MQQVDGLVKKLHPGTEEIEIKRGGISSFVLDCRRNNEFINQAVAITIVKSTADYFIFDERGEEPDFVSNIQQMKSYFCKPSSW